MIDGENRGPGAAARAAASGPLPAGVAVVIVNWNGLALTRSCLDALLQAGLPPQSLFVVDNGSSDGSVPALRSHFATVNLIEAGENLGFARGNNLGVGHVLRETRAPAIFLLNNDALVDGQCLPRLLAALAATPVAGAAVPKICYADGQRLWYGGGHIDWKAGTGVQHGQGERDRGQADRPGFVTFAPACALLLRRELIDPDGPFDTRYYFMGEDVDLSLRLAAAARPILYVPSATVRHEVGSSSTRRGRAFVWYHMTRNRLLTVGKHASARQRALFFAWWPAFWSARALLFALQGDPALARAMWQGVRDYRTGYFGPYDGNR